MAHATKTQRTQVRNTYRVFKNTTRTHVVSVRKSNLYLYVQLVDVAAKKVIAGVSSRSLNKTKYNKAIAKELGTKFGKTVQDKTQKGLEIAFNRGAYAYHGCVKELAEGLREAGLVF